MRTAVILAAGMGTRLGEQGLVQPKGFLRLGKATIIEESLARLERAGIRRVIIVTGHCREAYEDLAKSNGNTIRTVRNDRYMDSGSMYSLYCARDEIDEDFLLLESDLIYEQRALDAVLSHPEDTCVLLSGLTRSSDEVFVQTDGDRLVNMSKNAKLLESVRGEFVGITRISMTLFSEMLQLAETAFSDTYHYDYETDCLVAAGSRVPVFCRVESDLAWAEIDDSSHLYRARSTVYPEIGMRDSEL